MVAALKILIGISDSQVINLLKQLFFVYVFFLVTHGAVEISNQMIDRVCSQHLINGVGLSSR